jgi:hypothetical protein
MWNCGCTFFYAALYVIMDVLWRQENGKSGSDCGLRIVFIGLQGDMVGFGKARCGTNIVLLSSKQKVISPKYKVHR